MRAIGATSEGQVDEGFEALSRAEFAREVRLAHLLTGSTEGSDDIAQEAFLRLRSRLDQIDNPAGYIHRTIVNLSRSWHRTNARRIRRERAWHDSAPPLPAMWSPSRSAAP